MDERKPILVLDFDGVIHSYGSGWKGADMIPDPPVDGVFEFLYDAIEHFDVCVFSSRSGLEGGIEAMKEWIRKWDIEYGKELVKNGVPHPPGSISYQLEFPTQKPPAMLTIDDRALTFMGNWSDFIPKDLLNFKTWNSKGVG